MIVGEDRPRVVGTLEEVAAREVSPVKAHCVHALETLHTAMKRLRLGPNDVVDVISEQAPRKKIPAKPHDDIVEQIQEEVAIRGVEKDPAATVPGHRDQVNLALGPEAGSVRHPESNVARAT